MTGQGMNRRPSLSMAVALLALFISLSGVAYSANGGSFILGQGNTATSQSTLTAPVVGKAALRVVNTDPTTGATAVGFATAAGHPPFAVTSGTKVSSLNSDRLDGLDSTELLKKGVRQTASISTAGGLVDVMNTGGSNGVQGIAASGGASGVYGESTGGGFGVAGRSGSGGSGIFGENTGSGYAGYFQGQVHIGGNVSVDGLLDCFSCLAGEDVTGKVGDADQLDGIDSSGFMRGGAAARAAAVSPGVNLFLGAPILGFLRLSYFCPNTTSNNGTLVVYNDSGDVANVFANSGGANPTYTQMNPGDSMNLGAAASGDSFDIQAQGALGVLTIDAATVNRASDCHAQAQGILTS